MSRRSPSPPPFTASPLTVPDSPSPRSPDGARTPLAPVLPAPATEPMPVECPTGAPHSCPSPPSSPPRGEVTPEFAVPPLAACPVCLQAPASQPQAEDAVFPCFALRSRLCCLVQCALRHGSCPNCRAAVDHLPREPSIASRCRQLGIDLEPTVPPAHDTAVTAVRDYSTRTFSRADAPEPAKPLHIRAVCCRRLAGPAMDFVELPDARMHWAPVPQRRSDGIGAWQPLWLCIRPPAAHLLQNHLHPAPPQPSPSCGTLRDGFRLPTRSCRKTSPRSEPTVPVPSRSQRSLRACGLPGAGRQPGRQGPPTSICVSFSTTKAIPSSCTAPPAALRMPTSRHPLWLLCASAG